MSEEELKAENARLKAEVERLSAELSNITGWGRGLESDLCRARAELMLEKAEVERLTSCYGGANLECEAHLTECKRLKAESERLKEDNRQITKAFEIAKQGGQP